jgi:hypothetical protein
VQRLWYQLECRSLLLALLSIGGRGTCPPWGHWDGDTIHSIKRKLLGESDLCLCLVSPVLMPYCL